MHATSSLRPAWILAYHLKFGPKKNPSKRFQRSSISDSERHPAMPLSADLKPPSKQSGSAASALLRNLDRLGTAARLGASHTAAASTSACSLCSLLLPVAKLPSSSTNTASGSSPIDTARPSSILFSSSPFRFSVHVRLLETKWDTGTASDHLLALLPYTTTFSKFK